MRVTLPLVLMYHGVAEVPADRDPDNLFVPPEALAAQVDRLLARGFTIIDERAYLAALDGTPTPRRSVLLTFDDGFESVLTEGAPILARRSAPAICYVSPGLLGRGPLSPDSPETALLDADQVRSLPEHGVAVGGHGWEHESMPGLDRARLTRSTTGARTALQDLLGSPVRTFAYPFGHWDLPARDATRAAGYSCAFSVCDGRGRFTIPRVDINATDTIRSFDLKVTRGFRTVHRAASRTPRVRRWAHKAVGYAERR